MSAIQELFQKARRLLKTVAAEPSVEAKIILMKSTGFTAEQFFASPEKQLSRREENDFERLLERRLSGVPLAYLTGTKEFWSLPLAVLPGVFIPRPETELIVEKVLEFSVIKEERIIDIGTGCGNIAIALAKELPRARVVATDISVRALRLARLNARKHGARRVVLVRGNLFSALEGLDLEGRCDFIVSNPPYVPAGDWATLSPEVWHHEPRRALVPGKTGLEFIRRLIEGAPAFLRKGGHLLFEIGHGQRKGALSLFDQRWREVESFDDLRGIPRIIKARI